MSGNRNIERLRLKRIKQIRARPRYLKMNDGYMKGQSSVDKSRVPEEALPLLDYRGRAKINEHAENTIEFVNTVLGVLFPDMSTPKPVERQHEHMRLKVNKLDPVERKLLIENTRFVKTAIISDRDMTCVTFLQYQVIPKLLRRSITYSSFDRAMQVFHLKTVRWKEDIPIDG